MRETRNGNKFWLENLKRRDHMVNLDLDARIILRWDLTKMGCQVMD
jgi:hypothetical protein